jgi:hypothetical protein
MADQTDCFVLMEYRIPDLFKLEWNMYSAGLGVRRVRGEELSAI